MTFILVALLMLVGCTQQTAKNAKQHGSGISITMGEDLNIKQMQLKIYEGNLKELFSENVIYADSSEFSKGDVIWFDVSPSIINTDPTISVELSYSENIDGTSAKPTKKIDISNAKQWVNLELNDNYELTITEQN